MAETEIVNNKKLTQGSRVSGKPWKTEKKSLNISLNHKTNQPGFNERKQRQEQEKLVKQKLAAMKEEKINEKKAKTEERKKRQEEKLEKERYQRLAEKYHKKKVERMRRKEKRNKLLSDGKK